MYPIVRAEIRDTDSGDYLGLVDGDVIATNVDMKPVRDEIVAAAARLAARREGSVQAIRVRVTSPDAEVFLAVVTADGKVYDTTTPAEEPAAVKAPSRASARSGGVRPWGRKETAAKSSIQLPDDTGSKKGRPHPLLFLILGFPLVLVATVLGLLFFRGGETTETVDLPEPRQLPVVAPQGYSPVAPWAVKLSTNSGMAGGVAADNERVYVASGAADHVTAYAAVDGREEWSVDLGATLSAGPALTVVDGEPTVVAATSSQLRALDPDSGATVGEWRLDETAGSQVQITATGPVVVGATNTAQIIDEGDLVTRMLPAGAMPVAPGPGGSLIAATHDRVYASTSDTVSGAGQPIEPATGGAMTVAGWTGDRLVLAYGASSSTGSATRLAAYAVPETADGRWTREWVSQPLASTSMTAVAGVGRNVLPLMAGPAGAWGIYGSTVVDLATGKLTGLAEWTTSAVGDEIAFGTSTSTSEVLSAGPKGLGGRASVNPPDAMGSTTNTMQVLAPQAVSGSSAYLVTAGGGTTPWLYALTPAGSSAAAAPSPLAGPSGSVSAESGEPE